MRSTDELRVKRFFWEAQQIKILAPLDGKALVTKYLGQLNKLMGRG